MSQILIENLTFNYDGSYDNIFENVSFCLDTDWKLGLIGRNGRGKTTFMKLLMKEYKYTGNIAASVNFDYFPFQVDENLTALQVARGTIAPFDRWEAEMEELVAARDFDAKRYDQVLSDYEYADGYAIDDMIEREIAKLGVGSEVLSRSFGTLSQGERVKILLASMFLKKNNFLLLDEPTNHLDQDGRLSVQNYLKDKSGFILASHDRKLLDAVCDHILSINRSSIEVQRGNFSSWRQNKDYQDSFELAKNENLKRDIAQLQKAAARTANWSDNAEKEKHTRVAGLRPDTGFMGHKAAKVMQRSKSMEARQQKAIDEKSSLLRDIEETEPLSFKPLTHHSQRLIEALGLSVVYDRPLFKVDFELYQGERVAVTGSNGSGKSSLLKLIMGEDVPYSGCLKLAGGLVISYVPQDTSFLRGSLRDFARDNGLDESLFLALLRKLDFQRVQFSKDMEGYSAGQKKKVLIARSLCHSAHLYVWDEPLNFIDLFSRMQIEEAILSSKPTMLFVEHDAQFQENIATRVLEL